MITYVNPYDASVAHTSRNDAVNMIRDIIRDLADRVHTVEVHLDHVIVDGMFYSDYILMDEDGTLSDVQYDDPEIYATAMGLRLEVMPMGE